MTTPLQNLICDTKSEPLYLASTQLHKEEKSIEVPIAFEPSWSTQCLKL